MRYFAATGHTLSGAFKAYWDANGGLAQFGYPLCEPYAERNPAAPLLGHRVAVEAGHRVRRMAGQV